MKKDPHRYDDMLYLPHHQSSVHPPMSLLNRAAQFSPFAALTGYGDAVKETARLTDQKIRLDENSLADLNRKLLLLQEHLDEHPEVSFTYFLPDQKKEGGAYVTSTGIVAKILLQNRQIIFLSENTDPHSQTIPIDDIADIDGPLFHTLP